MKQMSLSTAGFERKTKRTRKREFLDEMNLVVPWAELVGLITPHAPARGTKGGRPPFAVDTMLRIHFLQQWFNLSDPAMEEALYDTLMFREFARLDMGEDHLLDESTILRFCHLLEAHNLSSQILATVNATLTAKGLLLKQGTVVDATLIAAPSSTKNSTGTRDPEMHQTKKGNQWHHGMKAHIGSDADLGLVHSVSTTAANANDVTQAHALLHAEISDARFHSPVSLSRLEELEPEIENNAKAEPINAEIEVLMKQKEPFEDELTVLMTRKIEEGIVDEGKIEALQKKISEIDGQISALIKQQQSMYNPNWGQLMRAGNEESYLAYQIERYACVYMPKLSDLLELSPRTYFRAPRRPLSHEITSV